MKKLFQLSFMLVVLKLFKQLMLDVNKRVYNHRPGPCRVVEGVEHGSEDIALVEDEGIAFVTSGVQYLTPRGKGVKGQIFLYDFKQEAKMTIKENFHPHGISHIATSLGIIRLFVINHSKSFQHSVFVLDWDRKARVLNLVKIIENEKFIRPNDLVAVSEDAFILSNDGSSQSSLLNMLEILSMYPFGSIVFYDGKVSHWLQSSVVSPNGIALDRERTHLIVSHINSELISIGYFQDYRSLSHVADIPLLTSADNLYVDKTGAVWTVSVRWAVLRIVFSKGYRSWEISEPFADDGRLISSSSIAVPYNNQLLIGSVCRQLVHCEIRPETI
uniref:Arylesterase n=1 Tax=Angiostrongylus cantonensis TaxID=6313 RepID=A0A158P868_ANGCA